MLKSKRDYKTLDKVVYFSIIEKIKTGELKPNEHLTEERLSKELGVSRSPIRKAITALVAEGVLDYRTYSGVVVKDSLVDSTRYVQLLEVIELFVKATLEKIEQMETEISTTDLRNCIQSMDRASYLKDLDEYLFNEHQFFLRLIAHSGNPYYKDMAKKVFFNITYFAVESINQINEDMRDRTIKHLNQIVDLLDKQAFQEANAEIKKLLGEFVVNAFR
ncbi:GntR family transcriptional regulator [Listeria costaricensis]|uniref:GntR family transcriptional regulator n=1 Tax=Listeria costaricensis TaxID=2026604 RepID=UPI000C06D513|nr:GntR family transcriptional regulator [Listeria costaricensis]